MNTIVEKGAELRRLAWQEESPLWNCPPGEVHVFHSRLSDWRETTGSFQDWLSPSEREHAAGFREESDRRRYVASQGLLRGLLSRYLGVLPGSVRIVSGAGGKPVLESAGNLSGPGPAIGFNLSRCLSHAAVAIAGTEMVGVDVEDRQGQVDVMRISRREFSPPEYQWIRSAPPQLRRSRFAVMWSCKEAFAKAVGLGLALPLDRFTIEAYGHTQPRISFLSDRFGDRQDWSLGTRELPGDCHLAAAARLPGARFVWNEIGGQ